MKNNLTINNKEIELTQEQVEKIKNVLSTGEYKKEIEGISSNQVAVGTYQSISEINWDEREEVLIKDIPNKMIFVNQRFSDKSVFGHSCVFIRCKFGNYCKFGSNCQFGSYCKFGSNCEFGPDCEFGYYCKFGSNCKFGYNCKR